MSFGRSGRGLPDLAGLPALLRALAACLATAMIVCACSTAAPAPASRSRQHKPSAAPSTSRAPGSAAASGCQSTFVPAYFYSSSIWAQAINTRPAPAVILLNVDNGVGTAPLSHFQTLVQQAHHAGITVLGYSSTTYGQRPISSVETEVREYRSWYGVNGIFLELHPVDHPERRCLDEPRCLPGPEVHVDSQRRDGL
jgi:hypothetical protein